MHNFSVAHKTEGSIYDEIVARVAYQYFEESRLSRDINKKIDWYRPKSGRLQL